MAIHIPPLGLKPPPPQQCQGPGLNQATPLPSLVVRLSLGLLWGRAVGPHFLQPLTRADAGLMGIL